MAKENTRAEQIKRMSRMDAIWEYAPPLTMTDFRKVLSLWYANPESRRWAIWVIGESGIGKNYAIEDAATDAALDFLWFPCKGVAPEDLRGFPALVRSLDSNGYEHDISGLVKMMHDYYSSEPMYKFQMLKYLDKAFQPGWKGYIHFDEYPQASKEVQEILYMLFYDRRIDDRKLSDDAMIIISMNPPSVSDYMLAKIQKAAQDRPTIFTLRPDVNEWLLWADGHNVHSLVRGFIREYPGVYEINKGRRLENLSAAVKAVELDNPNALTKEVLPAYVRSILTGCIDIESAERFVRYMKEVYDISGIMIMSGDNKHLDRLKSMMRSNDKAVHIHRIHNEIYDVMNNPKNGGEMVFGKNNPEEEESWQGPMQSVINYLKMVAKTDMDVVVSFIKGLDTVSSTSSGSKAKAVLNRKISEPKNRELYGAVLTALDSKSKKKPETEESSLKQLSAD